MAYEFFRFEVYSRLRQPGVWLFSALFALAAFASASSEAVTVGGGVGGTAIDAPFVITQMLGIFSVIGVVIATAFVATCVVRDFEQRTWSAFFTSPIRKRDLLLGRFFGSLVMVWLVFVATAVGIALGTAMPWLDPERLVGFQPGAYAYALVVLVFPNLFVMGAVFFAIGTLTRRVLWAYVGVAGFFVFYVVSQNLMSGLENDTLAAFADPFGMGAVATHTRYWTLAERNTLSPATGPLVLANRALWIGIGIVALAITQRFFRMQTPAEGGARRADDPGDVARIARDRPLPRVMPEHGPALAWSQLLHQARVELLGVVRSTAFVVIALFAGLNLLGSIYFTVDDLYGTPVHPVTRLMVRAIENSNGLFLLIVVIFYAGELAWKERRLGLAEVYDALPLPNWVPVVAKFIALCGALAIIQGVAVLTAMCVQLLRGWTELEPGLYLEGVFLIQLSQWMLLAALALFMQSLANNKYVGFLLVAGVFVLQQVMPALDLERALYRYGSSPSAPYSDMNGFGHFLTGVFWYRVYWSCGAAAMLGLGILLWPRGTDARWAQRWRAARRGFRGRVAAAMLTLLAGFAATGAYIFYNTDVLNHFEPSDQREQRQVSYEQRYKHLEAAAQPRITDVDLVVELYPEARRFDVHGTLTLRNRTREAIADLHVFVPPELQLRRLEAAGVSAAEHDPVLGYHRLALASPLVPDATMTLAFELGFDEPGFVERGSNTEVVYNGSFLHSPAFVPRIGYERDNELSDANERRKRQLPTRARTADLDDASARARNYVSGEADWINFAATIGTSEDQLALAPGYLQREWHEHGRHYFRYEMDAPILDFYAVLSGRWEVLRDRWNDVAIEVYHHPGHGMNAPRMVEATKAALDYFTANFSPYQHRQLRIVEFPAYATYAQSFPNTIPYSESIGFIADLRDPSDIDYVFYVTAHEVAHQWWAHQVIGAAAQGSTLLAETLSQYSALMVMEKTYGREHMRRFLAFELDRYLAGRGNEPLRELPLMRVEDQPYIHYNKGSLVMYALREYIGEDAVNGVLAGFLRDYAFAGPPYPTARDLVDRFRAATPEQYAYLIEDLFETITLFDNRTKAARARALPEGGFEIELEVETRKLRAGDDGSETPIAIADFLEIGALGERTIDGRTEEYPIALQWQRFDRDTSTVTFRVPAQAGRPLRAGIDPRALLVDREPSDNLRSVEFVD
ncbi:MAG: ABC transporter permease subunit [Nannocystaceae bacterium]|nr:ABC transporter permease subunit [Deltaproteobacteria bacterium]MBP7284975.1 ABC transporter permease subunit [Nannocystaceae bacterium]